MRLELIKKVIQELEDNFQYLHFITIVKYCKLYNLNKSEILEVYNMVEYKIDYTSNI